MSHGTSTAKTLRWSALMMSSTGASVVLGMIQVAVLTRLLGKDQYGRLVLIMAVTMTVRQLIGVRVWEWSMKELAAALVARDPRHAAHAVRSGYVLSAMVNAISALIVVAVSPLAAHQLLHDGAAWPWVVLFGATLLATWAYDTCFATLRVLGRFRFLALHGVATPALRLVLVGGAVWIWRDFRVAVFAYVVLEVLISAWILLAAEHAFRGQFGGAWWKLATGAPPWRKRAVRKLLVVGSVVDTVKVIGTRADVLILGWFATPAAVGVYNAAWVFIDGISRVANPVAMVIFADLAKLGAARDGQALLRLCRRVSAAALVATVPISLALLVLAPWIVGLFYGERYADAVPILQVLAFCPTWLVAIWLQPAFVSIDRVEWGLEFALVTTAAKLILLFALVPVLGPIGLAIGALVYHVLCPILTPLYYARIARVVRAPAFASGAAA